MEKQQTPRSHKLDFVVVGLKSDLLEMREHKPEPAQRRAHRARIERTQRAVEALTLVRDLVNDMDPEGIVSATRVARFLLEAYQWETGRKHRGTMRTTPVAVWDADVDATKMSDGGGIRGPLDGSENAHTVIERARSMEHCDALTAALSGPLSEFAEAAAMMR